MSQIRNLIVIGASAGGIKAIVKLIEGFPETIDAAIMIVLHVSKKSSAENIVEIFQRHTTLKCLVAKDRTDIEKGIIYLAQPEHHLLVSAALCVSTRGLKKINTGLLLMFFFVQQLFILEIRQ